MPLDSGPLQERSSRPHPGRAEAWVGVAGRATAALLLLGPLAWAQWQGVTFCPTAGLLGVPCPGCGLTRAALAAASGHFAEALRIHPLVGLVGPVYLLVVGVPIFEYVAGVSLPRPRRSVENPLLLALAASLVLVWAARFLGALGGPVSVVRWSVGG